MIKIFLIKIFLAFFLTIVYLAIIKFHLLNSINGALLIGVALLSLSVIIKNKKGEL